MYEKIIETTILKFINRHNCTCEIVLQDFEQQSYEQPYCGT